MRLTAEAEGVVSSILRNTAPYVNTQAHNIILTNHGPVSERQVRLLYKTTCRLCGAPIAAGTATSYVAEGEPPVNGELALTEGRDAPAWRATGDPSTLAGWQQYAVTEVTPQAVVGVA